MKKDNILYLLILISFFIKFSDLKTEVLENYEKQIIFDLLERNDFDSNSVNFLKDWSSTTRFKLPVVVDIINNPLQFPEFVSSQEELIKTKDIQLIIEEFSRILYDYENESDLTANFNPDFLDLYEEIEIQKNDDIFDYVIFSWGTVKTYLQEAVANLTDSEMDKLTYLAYAIPMEEMDTASYEEYFLKYDINEYELEIEDYFEIIEKVDFTKIGYAFWLSQHLLENLISKLKDFNFKNKKLITKESEFGTLCIGTKNTDVYDKEYQFILDPGGDDLYSGRLNSDRNNNLFWTIDLNGNDYYSNDEISGLLNAVWGIAQHFDLAGDDVYYGGDHSLSASFGCSSISDLAGNDIYEAGLHSLGAASFGISILNDEAGNDLYSITEFGEGYAGTLAIGLLADHAGNDLYYAGGKYLHEPLAPLDYRSMAQGFGYGVRPDLAGGIGILYDNSGNDRYNGGVYAQAVAYWYALGIIIDKEGNDFYTAVYYPQGSGIHLAGGFLYDQSGEDHYYSKHGPGQGAGHDYAVGFLVDRAGNDSYSVEGGNGLGLTNSVGVFLDVSGDDRYERRNSSSYGYANQARDSGGLGIFLDTGGEDSYPDTTRSNDSNWVKGTYGLGLDTLLVEEQKTVEKMAEEEAAGIDSLAEISVIFSIASQWGVGSAAKRVEIAGDILLDRENEAADYIFSTQMATKSGLVYRALEKFVKGSETFHNYIPDLLQHEDSLCVKNTMSLIGDLGDSTYIDTLYKFVKAELYLKTALSALGRIKSDKSAEILKDFRFADSEKIRVITARGLKKIGSDYSNELLFEMEDDPSFLIQTMIRLFKNKLLLSQE